MKQVLVSLITAYEIQGCFQIKNGFNRVGLDHTILAKIASTAVVSWMMGLSREQACAAVSHAWVDGHPLRIFRQAPNAGPRKGWAAGGSYQVVRIIRNFVERWDRTPLREQDRIFGRHKDSGATLGRIEEHALPDYASDPAGARTPMDAHIRLANPRTPETLSSLILRRGYNYSAGITPSGQLDMGLLFVCYQSDLDAGFVAVQNRLKGEPLEEYIKPVGGGYFYALPGVPGPDGLPDGFLGQGLLVGA